MKRNEVLNVDEPPKHNVSERSQIHRFQDLIYMKYPELVKPQKQNTDWWLPEAGEKEE